MNQKLARGLGFGSYFFWLAAIVLYGVATFSPNTYIVRLSTGNSTESVKLDLGYLQLCVSDPLPAGSTKESSSQCHLFPTFNADKTPKELATDWIEDLDLASPPPDQYSTDVGSLLDVARSLRINMFIGTDLIAAFVLLVIGGLVLLVPVFFNFTYRRKICYVLMMISTLILGFGFMVAGAAVFTAYRAQSLLDSENPLTAALDANAISIAKGSVLRQVIRAGLILNGIFLVLIAITAFVRHKFGGKAPVHSGRPRFEQIPQHLPLYEPPTRKAPKADGKKPKKEKKTKKGTASRT
ncbi:hypothetical protein AK830_g7712 [Neonectria ditissima]|uniref:Uncharacterized protein n=1 Tax=Neonectria ditissima TaxID=78410 RepID=A0A0P7B9J1_9HYPO|nr:hypothetical protein AK830_g7712 [Neonectria ditissima]